MSASLSRPVFIISPPRSGSTLLYNVLADAPQVWSMRGEGHHVFESIPGLHPRDRGWASNRLTAEDATADVVAELTRGFLAHASDRDGRRPEPGDEVIFLEKTPKNCLRVPFLAAAFPDARFVYLHRDAPETISSMIEGWRLDQPSFRQYPDLPGWQGQPWSFFLFPGWREMIGRPVPEIAAVQWATAVDLFLGDLTELPRERWYAASFDGLLADPAKEVEGICDFLGWSYDRHLTAPLPWSKTVVTVPEKDKWRENADEIESILPLAAGAAERAATVFASRR
jgi:hypothetical protein